MTETFTWKSEVGGTSGSGEFKMATAQFGDGYSQDASIGLNPERQKWPVSVSGFRAQLQPVVDFVRDHSGSTPFYWTPPFGVQGYYKCKTWNLSPNGGDHWTLQLEFEQTYIPT